MSLSDDEDDLPMPKKQRIYYGSLEEKLRDIASGGSGQKASHGDDDGGDEAKDDGDESDEDRSDNGNEVNDPIAQAIKAGNINISEGKSKSNRPYIL